MGTSQGQDARTIVGVQSSPAIRISICRWPPAFALYRIARVSPSPRSNSRVSRAAGLPRLVRVLVVDDNHDMATTLAMLLRADGFETHAAFSGVEALKILEEVQPDALIVDIAMPGMTGWELAQNVRQRGTGERLMLIAISGEYSERANTLFGDKGGFNYFLSKPCDPNVVLNLLRPLKARILSQ